mmetsp:Transcript_47471/g.120243  ORF Transcript_47471/g.120243 Transcript_47471/m.120243 type:complete len:214 (-) Transcript_47471:411-1052(-)
MLGHQALRDHQGLQSIQLLHRDLVVADEEPLECVRRATHRDLLRHHLEETLGKGLHATLCLLQECGLATEPDVATFVRLVDLDVVAAGFQLDARVREGEPLQVARRHLVVHAPEAVRERGVHGRQILEQLVVAFGRVRPRRHANRSMATLRASRPHLTIGPKQGNTLQNSAHKVALELCPYSALAGRHGHLQRSRVLLGPDEQRASRDRHDLT